jgi:serine/threonine protein kinase
VKLISLHPSDRVDRAGREIVSLVRLEANIRNQHPNLLGIQHVGQTAQHLFYVMDPADDVAGSPASSDPSYRPATLRERLRDGPLPPEDCFLYSRQLVAGLACIHKAGMVHRDVKPANCLFVGGELKLADFGLLTAASTQISRVGTPKYMPPDGHMDARGDAYSAGLVIYEMLTGLPAESFPHLGERARDVVHSPVLRGLNRLILRACQPDPQQRFADAEAMLAQLTTNGSKQPGHPVRARRLVLTAIACLAALTASAAVKFWPSQPAVVDVSFITQPFGAMIYLDGNVLLQPDGAPYTTPCTIPDVAAKTHHVSFKREGATDLDVGEIDVARNREVMARWDDSATRP